MSTDTRNTLLAVAGISIPAIGIAVVGLVGWKYIGELFGFKRTDAEQGGKTERTKTVWGVIGSVAASVIKLIA